MRYLWRPDPGYLSPRSRRERGADVIEAALVLPIILALMLGLVDFARGWNIYQTMTRAAREGVRQTVTTNCATCGNNYYTSTQIENNIVYPALQAGGVNPSNPVFTSSYEYGDAPIASGDVCGAYITFKYPYKIAVPFIGLNIGTIDLKTYVQMRMENQNPDGTCP